MSTLTTLRATLRIDLHDEDAGAYRWTDAELERHLQRAVEEYQATAPVPTTKDLTALASTYAYALTGGDAIAGLLAIERVEYPQGETPPAFVPWQLEGTTLTLYLVNQPVTAGATIRVHAGIKHTVDGAGSTIPPEHEHIVLRGALGYACLALANYSINRVNTSAEAEKQYTFTGRDALKQFSYDLKDIRRERTQRSPTTSTITGYEV